MSAIVIRSSPLEDRLRRELIFQGSIIVFTNLPEMNELCAFAHELARKAFGKFDPLTAQAVSLLQAPSLQWKGYIRADFIFASALFLPI